MAAWGERPGGAGGRGREAPGLPQALPPPLPGGPRAVAPGTPALRSGVRAAPGPLGRAGR